MQVTSLLSRQEPDDHNHEHGEHCETCGHDHGHDQDHSHASLPLLQTISGLILIINSFVVTWIFSGETQFYQGGSGSMIGTLTTNPVAAASAMIGAIILGYPIVWTAGPGFAARLADDQ